MSIMEIEGKIRYNSQKYVCNKSRVRDTLNVKGGNKYNKKWFYV